MASEPDPSYETSRNLLGQAPLSHLGHQLWDTRTGSSPRESAHFTGRNSQDGPSRSSSTRRVGDRPRSAQSAPRASFTEEKEVQPLDESPKSKNEWEWMSNVDWEEYFMDLNENAPPKSLDCGSEGHIASLTGYHELLCIGSPHPQCGMIYMMGRFPRTAEAVLARVERRDQTGSKGTFGIQFLPNPENEYSLRGCVVRGLINHRWPHAQYGFGSPKFSGSGWYEQSTFVNDGIIYQVTRITNGAEELKTNAGDTAKPPICKFRVGGPVSFGCLCAIPEWGAQQHQADIQLHEDSKVLTCNVTMTVPRCQTSSFTRCSFHMELFVNGEKRSIKLQKKDELHGSRSGSGKELETDLSSVHTVRLVPGKESVIVLAMSLGNGITSPRIHHSMPTSQSVKTILGVENDVERGVFNQSGSLWFFNQQEDDFLDSSDLNAMARTSEYLLSVSSLYLKPFDMSDSSSLTVLLDAIKDSKGRQGESQPEIDPASIELPREPVQEAAEGSNGNTQSLTWSTHGTWLEAAVMVENVLFAPYVDIKSVL